MKPEDIPRVGVDKESGYLFAFISNVDRRLIAYYAPLGEMKKERIAWKKLFTPEDDVHDFELTNRDIYFLTPKTRRDTRSSRCLSKTPS